MEKGSFKYLPTYRNCNAVFSLSKTVVIFLQLTFYKVSVSNFCHKTQNKQKLCTQNNYQFIESDAHCKQYNKES